MNSHKLFFYKQNLLVTIDGDWLICFVCITKVTVGARTNLVFICDSSFVNFMLDLIPVITGMRSNIKLTNELSQIKTKFVLAPTVTLVIHTKQMSQSPSIVTNRFCL